MVKRKYGEMMDPNADAKRLAELKEDAERLQAGGRLSRQDVRRCQDDAARSPPYDWPRTSDAAVTAAQQEQEQEQGQGHAVLAEHAPDTDETRSLDGVADGVAAAATESPAEIISKAVAKPKTESQVKLVDELGKQLLRMKEFTEIRFRDTQDSDGFRKHYDEVIKNLDRLCAELVSTLPGDSKKDYLSLAKPLVATSLSLGELWQGACRRGDALMEKNSALQEDVDKQRHKV